MDAAVPAPRAYLTRWYILLIFSLLAFTQSAWWITFSTVAPQVQSFYGIGEPAINLLVSWGMIVFVPVAPFAMYSLALPKGGLRWSIVVTSIIVFAGTLIRALPCFFPKSKWAFVLLSLGQILNAAGGPVLGMAPPQISARWFPANERTISTGIGVSFSNLGSGTAFLVGPLLIDRIGLTYFLWLTSAVSGLLCLATVIYFPDAPLSPPSISEGLSEQHQTLNLAEFKAGVIECLKNPSFMVLIIIGSLQLGVMSAWTSIFDFILIPTFTEETVGLLGFFYTLSYTFACVVSGVLVDKIFGQKFKALLLSFLGLAIVFLAIWSLSFSSFLTPNHRALFSFPKWVIMVMINVIGFLFGAATPLLFELGVELTYPIRESYSTGLLTAFLNLFALLMMVPETYLPANWINGMVAIVIFTSTFALFAVKEEYKRSRLDTSRTVAINEGTPLFTSGKF